MNKENQNLIKVVKESKQKPYNVGSCRQAFLVKNLMLKTPKYSNKFSLFNSYNKLNREYIAYLQGIYQTLKEIQIWKENKFNDIIAPIEDYGIFEGQLYTLNKKIIPANICLDEKDFDLEYFCQKMGCKNQYALLLKRITSMSIFYNLDLYDLLDSEDNFGFDFVKNKILLLDYGCCDQNNYNKIDFLIKENKKMFNMLFKEEQNNVYIQ